MFAYQFISVFGENDIMKKKQRTLVRILFGCINSERPDYRLQQDKIREQFYLGNNEAYLSLQAYFSYQVKGTETKR